MTAPGQQADSPPVLMRVSNLWHMYGRIRACEDISLSVGPGEVLAVVGESGSGKTTLLNCLAGNLAPTNGRIEYDVPGRGMTEIYKLPEPQRRCLARTEWGFVHQDPSAGLRMNVSAGGNIGERLMSNGARHYRTIRDSAVRWMEQVELDTARIDDPPRAFSGGMRQRLQIARNLVTTPRLVFMDEPTGGLDVSVQARILDLLRGLVRELHLSVVLVTHDLGVARLLADRLMVMRQGQVIEQGLTDQVLDDPQHAYTQLLVSSVLQG